MEVYQSNYLDNDLFNRFAHAAEPSYLDSRADGNVWDLKLVWVTWVVGVTGETILVFLLGAIASNIQGPLRKPLMHNGFKPQKLKEMLLFFTCRVHACQDQVRRKNEI